MFHAFIRLILDLSAVISGICLYTWLVVKFSEHMVQTLDQSHLEEKNTPTQSTPSTQDHE